MLNKIYYRDKIGRKVYVADYIAYLVEPFVDQSHPSYGKIYYGLVSGIVLAEPYQTFPNRLLVNIISLLDKKKFPIRYDFHTWKVNALPLMPS